VAVDSIYYRQFTITPVNFAITNLSSVSLFYGSNPWHYYVTQALPILCTTALPFAANAMWMTVSSNSPHNQPLKTMLATIVWTIGVYSFAGHKEWRFIHPLLPLLHIFAAKSLVDSASTSGPSRVKNKARSQDGLYSRILNRFNLPSISIRHIVLLLITLPVSFYIILFYCSGPISILSYFQTIPMEDLKDITIGVLMPCHSTPGFSYLHRPELTQGRIWALGCEPPLEYVRCF